jgi:SAM-dependent methyltransferase
MDLARTVRAVGPRSFYVRLTKRYVRPDSGPIIEGGCGMGQFVHAFTQAGYRCTGVDYAAETVRRVKELAPELDIRAADLRELPFPDNVFSAYWSLGVIEHYWDGYVPLVSEMTRVLKPGGYLFLTFPALSPLRRLKVRLGAYPAYSSPDAPPGFYQFILDPRREMAVFREHGFAARMLRLQSGTHGLADELPAFAPLVKTLSGLAARKRPWRYVEAALGRSLAPFAGHVALVVLQKAAG